MQITKFNEKNIVNSKYQNSKPKDINPPITPYRNSNISYIDIPAYKLTLDTFGIKLGKNAVSFNKKIDISFTSTIDLSQFKTINDEFLKHAELFIEKFQSLLNLLPNN